MTSKRRTYLIQDPYDLDALAFIETIRRHFGLRPVCFYTDPKGRFYGERRFPILRDINAIEAAYDVRLDDVETFARDVQRDFDIAAVIPYREDTVEVAAQLLQWLPLQWNAADTLARFRNKFELKRFIAEASDVRVPQCRLVADVDEAMAGAPQRFVLKPNDGFGNRSIGIFNADQRADVAAHLREHAESTWLREEFIEGREFAINGQVRSSGQVQVLGIYESLRVAANGHGSVYYCDPSVASSDPVFNELVDYAVRLLTATGLQRSPFHLEVRYDHQGPCVIDLGARFPSDGGAALMTRWQPSRPDVYAVAAHDYFGPNDVACDPFDADAYDRNLYCTYYGITSDTATVQSVEGLDAVAALPEFVEWISTPQIGQRIVPTRELHDAPYIAVFRQPSDRAGIDELGDRIRSLVRWNETTSALAPLRASATSIAARGRAKAPWLLHRARQRRS
jgi:hypothetical protein